jgi:outer membrane protein assembly factor BamD
MTLRPGLSTGLTRVLIVLTLLAMTTGCARFGWFQKKDDPVETLPVAELYDMAKGALEANNYGKAQRVYQRLVARFPFGPLTEQSQLELAYAQFKGGLHEDATSTVNRFVRTYPAHPQIAYAYYLRALINFERDSTFLTRVARIDTTTRDMSAARQSFSDFGELIRRYPNTRYAADASQRMAHLSNAMAQHEINVATFYLERGAWVAARNRGQFVLESFPQSAFTGDALAVITESYVRLGQDQLATDSRRVLELNQPQHPYLSGNWPARESFWRKLVPLGGMQN